MFELCLRCVQWQHCIVSIYCYLCSCGSFLPSTSLSVFCRDTAPYNEIFTIICVSTKTIYTAIKKTWLISAQFVQTILYNIAKFHSRDSSIIKQHSSKFYEGRSWNILNKNTSKERDCKHKVTSCHWEQISHCHLNTPQVCLDQGATDHFWAYIMKRKSRKFL